MADSFTFKKLDKAQSKLLATHLEAATRSSRSTESLRDPLEQKFMREVVTKLYASLDLAVPQIYVLDSPMAGAFAWAHTPQTVADRWRVFHDEFYTHPLSSPVVDVITDGFNAFTRLVEGNISNSISGEINSKMREQYDDLARVGDVVETAITSVEKPLQTAELVASFYDQVDANITDPAIKKSIRQPMPNVEKLFLPGNMFRGQHYTYTAYLQALSELGLPFVGYHKNLINLWQQMNKACGWWFPYKNVLLVSDRPSALHVDERGRPHSLKGPAIAYRDDWKIYAYKGILIPKNIIEKPETITVKQIMDENNTEIRRAMVDIFGLDRFVTESKSKVLDSHGEYELLQVPYLSTGSMIALKMRCPTTAAVYVHTVHPDCSNVEQALAWKRGEDNFRAARPYKEGLLWEM